MASRRIDDLHPDLQGKAREFVQECKKEGIEVLIYMTYRSNEEQNELYAKGRTAPGPKVTNAKGGQSDHNFMLDGKPAAKAFDAVPLRVIEGKKRPVWNDPKLYELMGEVAERVGLKWGGNWKKFVDRPHFYID
jgi:peptidoglycan L-alanyl-D-glutamate endopeptidase CwlK